MSFLTPLYLLGGLAVALPVVFHLVRRASRERITFSSLMFLQPTPPRMTRRNRLEHLLLLALRCLAILALSAAFARPFLPQPIAVPPSVGEVTRTVILVDVSASMRREGLWAEALNRAESWMRRAGPSDQVALFAFDTQARSVIDFDAWDRLAIGERAAEGSSRLRALQPTWLATQVGQAMIRGVEALEEAAKLGSAGGPRRIVLVTDLQEGGHAETVQGFDWPKGVDVVVEAVKARRSTNAGLQWIAESEDAERTSRDAGLRLRVSNSADAQREQFQVRWEDATAGASLDAYVPPGQGRILAAPAGATERVAGRLVLTGDDDAFDNSVHVVAPRQERVDVLFVGEASEKDPAQLLYYLKRTFQGTRRQRVALAGISPGALGRETAGLSTNRLVIVGSALGEEGVAAVRRYLESGGTVLCVLDRVEVAATLAGLVGIPGLRATEAPTSSYAMFGKMDFQHPILAPFADPRFSDFTKIRFWNHRRLDIDAWQGARVVARFDQDDPAIVEAAVGKGRLFAFAFSWRPAESQFALSSKFVPLMHSILDQASGSRPAPAQYRVGETVELAPLRAGNDGAASVLKPDGTRVELAPGVARFDQADQPGIYEFLSGTNRARFAVNLDPAESRTAPLPSDELARLGVPVAATVAVAAPQAVKSRNLHDAQLEARQKYWRWLLIAALGVLLVETWLAGWLTRRASARVEVTA